jgi:hypothetical protein
MTSKFVRVVCSGPTRASCTRVSFGFFRSRNVCHITPTGNTMLALVTGRPTTMSCMRDSASGVGIAASASVRSILNTGSAWSSADSTSSRTASACATSWWRAMFSAVSRVARRPSISTVMPAAITSAGRITSTAPGDANRRAIRAAGGRSPVVSVETGASPTPEG